MSDIRLVQSRLLSFSFEILLCWLLEVFNGLLVGREVKTDPVFLGREVYNVLVDADLGSDNLGVGFAERRKRVKPDWEVLMFEGVEHLRNESPPCSRSLSEKHASFLLSFSGLPV